MPRRFCMHVGLGSTFICLNFIECCFLCFVFLTGLPGPILIKVPK